jgi:hypothetical protein
MIKKELDLKGIDMDRATTSEMQDVKMIVRDKFLAALMLSRANRDKYGELKHSMAENSISVTSEYPESPEVVLRILSMYTPPPVSNRCIKQEGGGGAEGAIFVQLDRDDSWKKNTTCHKCKKKGNFARECRNPNKNVDQVHANIDRSKGLVNKNFLLLDNQSTVNQIANPNLLKSIQKSSKPITVHCNAGVTTTDLEGELGEMTVHHNPNSIMDMLTLKSVAQKHRVCVYSTSKGEETLATPAF